MTSRSSEVHVANKRSSLLANSTRRGVVDSRIDVVKIAGYTERYGGWGVMINARLLTSEKRQITYTAPTRY